jgi:predicted DNA-binding transcriptional regulator AlpA
MSTVAVPPSVLLGEPTAVQARQVPAKIAAVIAGVSLPTWHRLRAARKVPDPCRLGGRVMWNVEELQNWVDAGCPDADTWNAMKASRKGR